MDEDYDINSLTKEDDPLWDEQDESLMGYAFFKLEPISYLIATKNELNIINPFNGKLMGILEVNIIPHDEKNNEFDEVPDSPNDLMGQNLLYKISIVKVKNLDIHFCKNFRIEYQSFYDRSINYTKIYNQDERKYNKFDISEEFEHKIEYLSKENIDFLQKENIIFRIYAFEEVEKREKIKIEETEEIQSYPLERKNQLKIIRNKADEEPEEPSECINKDEGIKINNIYNNNKKNKVRGRAGSQTFKYKKDKDCIIF